MGQATRRIGFGIGNQLADKTMGIFASDKDEEDAYRTFEGMVGRSIRRGTDKAIKALTFGLLSGSHPV